MAKRFVRVVYAGFGHFKQPVPACRHHSTNGESKIYELRTYAVQPGKMSEYMAVMKEVLPVRTKYSKMNGFWYTELGGLNELIYLWEFDNFSHRTAVRKELGESKEWREVCLPKLLPLLTSQTNVLLKPFSWFKPRLDPVKGYGMYELVVHDLKPGLLSQFGHIMQQGLPARMNHDYPKPIGFWWSDFGPAHRVVSIYPHVDFEAREKHWSELLTDDNHQEWRETWRDCMKLMNDFTAKALIPVYLSPLQ